MEKNQTRLNKYIAKSGISSRRGADTLIASGMVSVNGKIVTQMGFKVNTDDIVKFNGSVIKGESLKYILLNKPKNYITTMRDPKDRNTVMQLIDGACKERVYPVGRLDRSTTGLLLFTNDGDLAKKLTHPSHSIKKIYRVSLNKELLLIDYKKIQNTLTLNDGPAPVDSIAYIKEKNKKDIGIELHIGRNRIVRRIFNHLGYKVLKLDRVFFGGLTKKDLPRKKFRFLSKKEVGLLKRL